MKVASFKTPPRHLPLSRIPLLLALSAIPLALFALNFNDVITFAPAQPCVPAFHVRMELDTHRQAFQTAAVAIRAAYPHLMANSSTSHDFYTLLSPTSVRHAADAVSWNAPVLAPIRKVFPKDTVFIRDVFDEVFISRRNLDLTGDHAVYTLHYDGIVRIPGASVCTIRTLSYLSGPPATFVAVSSLSNFTTIAGTAVVIDFNNEQHHVHMPSTDAAPRLVLKSGMHVVKSGTPRVVLLAYVAAHRLVFFLAKSFLEATKSNKSFGQRLVGLVFNNGFRVLNNVHAALPVLLAVPPAVIVLIAPLLYPLQLMAYLVNIYAVCVRDMSAMTVAIISLSLRTMAQVVLLLRVKPRQWAWGLLRGKLGAVLLVCGVLLHARAFSVLGLKGTYYARELEGWDTDLETVWPYDGSIPHPMHTAITLQAIGVGFLSGRKWMILMGLHVAWTWVVAFFEENAGVAHELLLAPLTYISQEEYGLRQKISQ